MRGGRLIVVAGVAMGIIAGVLVILLMMKGGAGTAAAEPTPEPPTVVRAAQNIAKGTVITLDAIQLVRLEAGEPTPPGAIDDPMLVAGMTAAMDISQGTILQQEMYIDVKALAEEGTSQASSLFEPGRVAIAIPIGPLTSVAGAIRSGDHVDVLAAFEFKDVDPETRVILPISGEYDQERTLESQLILQDLEVLRVGAWGTGADAGTATAEGGTVGGDYLTLLMPQQEALVMQWLMVKLEQGEARFTLALRAQDDDAVVSTDPVTLDHMMKQYKIIVPPKTPIVTVKIEGQGTIEAQ